MFKNKLGRSFSAVVICMVFLHTPAWSMDSQTVQTVDVRATISQLNEEALSTTGEVTSNLVSTLELSLHVLTDSPDSTSFFKPSFIVTLFKAINHVDSKGIDLLASIEDKDTFLRRIYLSFAERLEFSEREALLTALETWVKRDVLEGDSVELKTPERSEPSLSPPPSDSLSSSRSSTSSLASTGDSTITKSSTPSIESETKRPPKTTIAPFREGKLTASDVNFLKALHQADPLAKLVRLQQLSQGDHRAMTAIAHMRQIDPKRRLTPGIIANIYWISLEQLSKSTLQEMTLSNAIALNNLAVLIESNPNNLPNFTGTSQLLSWLGRYSSQTFYPPKMLYDLAAITGLNEAIKNAKNLSLRNKKRSIADPAKYYPSLSTLSSQNQPPKIHPAQTAAPTQNDCAPSATLPIPVQSIPFMIPVGNMALQQASYNAAPAHTYSQIIPQTMVPRNFGPHVSVTTVPQLQQVPMQMVQQRQQPTLMLVHPQQLQMQPVQSLPQQLPMQAAQQYQTTAVAPQEETLYPYPFKTAAGATIYLPVSALKKLQMDLNRK